ncbi:hypothetical protein MHYP_G00170140 [Metynnis hypsauchen]
MKRIRLPPLRSYPRLCGCSSPPVNQGSTEANCSGWAVLMRWMLLFGFYASFTRPTKEDPKLTGFALRAAGPAGCLWVTMAVFSCLLAAADVVPI